MVFKTGAVPMPTCSHTPPAKSPKDLGGYWTKKPKCTLAASHVAPGESLWVWRRDGQTNRRTDGRQTVTLRFRLDATSITSQGFNVLPHYLGKYLAPISLMVANITAGFFCAILCRKRLLRSTNRRRSLSSCGRTPLGSRSLLCRRYFLAVPPPR